MGPNENEILSKNYSIDIGKCISGGNEILKKNLGGFIGFVVLQFMISMAISAVFGGGIFALMSGEYQTGASGLQIVSNIVSNVVSALLIPGTFYVAHKIQNGEETSFGDFFYGFQNTPLQFILLQLIGGLLMALGFMCFLFPGIYLAVAWAFSVIIITVYKMDFWESMELSRKVINKVWWQLFLLFIVLFFVNLLGALVLLVGLLYTIPLSICAMYVAFHNIFLPNSSTLDDKISGFGADEKDINTERDENNYLK